MHQFKEIPLLESLLNFQKNAFYYLTVNCSMQMLITVFDPVICKTPDKVVTF